MSMERRVIKTADGSHTLEIIEMEDTYHSRHGALQESDYVFVGKGLNEKLVTQQQVSILEIGFGTGLNALVTKQAISSTNASVHYTALETSPVDQEEIALLNYTALIPALADFYSEMHKAKWGEVVALDEQFTLLKHQVAIEEFKSEERFDLVYFDAFGPASQPELWSLELLRKVYELTALGGIFVTYCAKGQVRRDLTEAGYTVERLPGPPGKRHMLRGVKS